MAGLKVLLIFWRIMIVAEYNFTDYYHKYVTIEADELTANLTGHIKVNEKDCYALCSSYVDEEGLVRFNVLSIGESWEHCTRGLKSKKMLGEFGIDEVYYKEMRVAETDFEMVEKNQAFMEEKDKTIDEDIQRTREDSRLDPLRDAYYPDVVYAGMIYDLTISEYAMRITGINGPFLVGELLEEPQDEMGVHEGEKVYALPYFNEGLRLFVLFGGDHLDKEQTLAMNQLIKETNEIGIDFNGISLKN